MALQCQQVGVAMSRDGRRLPHLGLPGASGGPFRQFQKHDFESRQLADTWPCSTCPGLEEGVLAPPSDPSTQTSQHHSLS